MIYFNMLDNIDLWNFLGIESISYCECDAECDGNALQLSKDCVKLHVPIVRSRCKTYKIYGANIINVEMNAQIFCNNNYQNKGLFGNRICFEWILDLLGSISLFSTWKCGLQSINSDYVDYYGIDECGIARKSTNSVKCVKFYDSFVSCLRQKGKDQLKIRLWIEPSPEINIGTFYRIYIEFWINQKLFLEYKDIDCGKMRLYVETDNAGFMIKSFKRMIK